MKYIISISFLLFSLVSFAQNFELLDSLIKEQKVTFIKDLKYGTKERNNLDLLLPSSVSKTPLIIYLHGEVIEVARKKIHIKKETYNSYQIL